jgi:hypothetical protein
MNNLLPSLISMLVHGISLCRLGKGRRPCPTQCNVGHATLCPTYETRILPKTDGAGA